MTKFIVVILFIIPLILSGQISIDSTEICSSIGTIWFEDNDTDVPINIGNPGGPQTWDFTFNLTNQTSDINILVDPSSAPFPDSFPDATTVMITTDYPNPIDSFCTYYQLTPSVWKFLGFAFTSSFGSHIMYIDSGGVNLPMDYQDNFRLVSVDSMDTGTILIVDESYIDGYFDAYGTLIIPAGSFPTLRARTLQQNITTVYVSGNPISWDTSWSVGYDWFGENYPVLATAYWDDTIANFTIAEDFSRFHSFTSVGVEEEPTNNTAINSIMLVKEIDCYYLSFTDLQSTEVNVFDLTGRLNFTSEISGSGKLKLDLENPGIYFVTYDNSNIYQSDKLIIIK